MLQKMSAELWEFMQFYLIEGQHLASKLPSIIECSAHPIVDLNCEHGSRIKLVAKARSYIICLRNC